MSPISADQPTLKFGELVTSLTVSLLMHPRLCLCFVKLLAIVILFYQVLQNIFLTISKRSKILHPDFNSQPCSTLAFRKALFWDPFFSFYTQNSSLHSFLTNLSQTTPSCARFLQSRSNRHSSPKHAGLHFRCKNMDDIKLSNNQSPQA